MILDIYKKKANIAYFEEAVENGYRMSIALEYDGNYYYRGVCGNRRQNIGQALALVNGENFRCHLVIVHRQVKHSCKRDSVHGTSAFLAGTSREMRPDYWRAKD